jgi:hypothetical protein
MTLVNVNYLYNLNYSGLVIPQHDSEFNLCDSWGCLASILTCFCNHVQILSSFCMNKISE